MANIQHELQTLRDAYQSNSKMIDIAITTADESHAHMLEYKSVASNLTYQFHTVSTKVDNFLATQAQLTPPTDHLSTIEEALQLQMLLLVMGLPLCRMRSGIGWIRRYRRGPNKPPLLGSVSPMSRTDGVIENHMTRMRHTPPRMHHLLLPRGPPHPHPPTPMALLTRSSVHGHKIAALPILIATLAHAEQKPTVILSVLGSMDLPLHATGLP